MARFIGRIKGGRGEVTRLGTPSSGIEASVSGWDVGVKVRAVDVDGDDVFFVYATSGSNNRASSVPVAVVRLDKKSGIVVRAMSSITPGGSARRSRPSR